MGRPLDGIKVLEVALYALVPSAGAVLTDWGADVIKVEHPETGDPIRGLVAWGVKPGDGGVTYLWEIFNRGKRSVGIDIDTDEGREVLMRLVDDADVFTTNFLGPARTRLGIEAEDILERNPRIIYARGTGHGIHGPDADKGGFDGISYWARSGAGVAAAPADYAYPIALPGPAFGDIQSGANLAGGIAAALFQRERTGKGSVVDTSLLASGLWAMQASAVACHVSDRERLPAFDRTNPSNPLANTYRTSDDRFINLAFLEADRYWPGFCRAIGRPELIDDPRFVDAPTRLANVRACVETLDAVFISKSLEEWKPILSSQEGQWSVMQGVREALQDEQAHLNNYIQDVKYDSGAVLPLVASPVQFDDQPATMSPGPNHAADTDEVLLAAGYDWDQLIALKERNAIS